MKPLLMLLLFSTATYRSQAQTNMPHLLKVFGSIEQKFQPVLGRLNEGKLPDSVYTSLLQIEETTENEIITSTDRYYAYFATIGSEIKSRDSILKLMSQWKDRIVLLASGYQIKSDKLTIIANTHLGYEFERFEFGSYDYLIQICFYKMEGSSKYAAYISFINTKATVHQ